MFPYSNIQLVNMSIFTCVDHVLSSTFSMRRTALPLH
jgi:hypothetical protein